MVARWCLALGAVSAAVVLEEIAELLVGLGLLELLGDPRELADLPRQLRALRPLVLEPAGLDSRLRAAVERRQLSQEELRTYRRDGMLLVRGLVRDYEALRQMHRSLALHQQFHGAEYVRSWEYNGAVRAFLRQDGLVWGLLGELMSESGEEALVMHEAPIWGHHGRADFDGLTIGSWHQDQSRWASDQKMVTVWMPVTGAPHTLEFLRGSHHVHAELGVACNRSFEIGAPGERLLDETCALKYSEKISEQLGHESFFWEDLEPGDAFIFDGNLAHRGIQWSKPRTALSFRLGIWQNQHIPTCEMRSEAAVFSSSTGNPMHCVQETFVARPKWLWPGLKMQLPEGRPGWPSSWAAWLLRAVAAAAGRAFLVHEDESG